jgi:adenylylsulfate kinase-like enzyme
VCRQVSPYRVDRDIARKRHEEQGLKFMEVFMDVPLDVVQGRDPKGLYKKVTGGPCHPPGLLACGAYSQLVSSD